MDRGPRHHSVFLQVPGKNTSERRNSPQRGDLRKVVLKPRWKVHLGTGGSLHLHRGQGPRGGCSGTRGQRKRVTTADHRIWKTEEKIMYAEAQRGREGPEGDTRHPDHNPSGNFSPSWRTRQGDLLNKPRAHKAPWETDKWKKALGKMDVQVLPPREKGRCLACDVCKAGTSKGRRRPANS